MADDIKQELGVWNQIQPAYRKPYNASWKSISYNMKEEIKSDVKSGDIAFKVECKMGTTYLRRKAFEIIKCASQPKEDLSYLIPLLESNNIT